MEISDVRIRLVQDSNDRLKAVCTVTFEDEFVVRDVKVVEGTHGLFVAMPSRKLTAACGKCRTQNQVRARFCNECGQKLPPVRIPADANGREKVHRDIAHPITPPFRQTIQDCVLEAYNREVETTYEEESDVPENEERRVEQDRYDDRERDDDSDMRKAHDEVDDDREHDEEPAGEESQVSAEYNDDEDEPDEDNVGNRMSDYDSLIAGLNRGGQGRPRQRDDDRSRGPGRPGAGGGPRGTHRTGTGEPRRNQPAGRGDQRGSQRGQDRTGHRESQGPPRRDVAPRRESTVPAPVSHARPAAREDAGRQQEKLPPRLDEVVRPVREVAPPPVSKPKPATPEPTETTAPNEDAPFGAGIL